MNVRAFAFAVFLSSVVPGQAYSQIINNDPMLNATALSQLAQMMQQIMTLKEQLTTMESQLDTQNSTLDRLSGSSAYGTLLPQSTNTLMGNLPTDWRTVYSDAMNSQSSLTGTAGSILGQFENQIANMPNDEAMRFASQQMRLKGAYDRAMAEAAYNNQMQELKDIQTLTNQISSTTSAKEIMDLQARIQTANGAVQGEMAKLQLMSMLQASQDKMLQQQQEQALKRFTIGNGDYTENSAPKLR